MLSSAVGINHRRKKKTLNNDSLRLSAAAVVLFAIIQLSWVEVAHCQPFDGTTVDPSEVPVDNPALVEYLTGVVYGRMSNLTTQFVNGNLAKVADFCINDPDLEWDRAFNYSSNLTFVSNCIIKTKGDVTRRICTAKEISLYFNSFNLSSEINSIPPNMNCNRTFWPAGCEPGWACSVNSNVQVDLTNSQVLPDRKQDCQACCEGFFCPSGLTCMIPCPLGSYCPLAQLNTNTGACDPYSYQLPLGQTNHTCGGANIWADVGSSEAIFCPAGSYCHTNINQRPCSKGNYCPMGSTAEKRCFKLASCDPSTASQNIHAYGVMLIVSVGYYIVTGVML